MKLRAFIILLAFAVTTSSNGKVNNDHKELQELIKSVFNPETNKIKVKGCQLNKKDWMNLLLMQKSFTQSIKYNKDCDLQGSFNPKMATFFPVKLNIKNHKTFKKLDTLIKIEVLFTDKTILKMTTKDSRISGTKNILFISTYSIAVDPLNPKKFLSKKLGGKLKILKINQKVINREFTL